MGRVRIERATPETARDADIRNYPVKAGETVQAGDVVDVVGGKVTKIGSPSQAIALQSGIAGQSIDVIFDGTAELPGITAGTRIDSPGVQGYCPQDGRLWVRPGWDEKPFVVGSYTGNGVNGRKIALGFKPSLLVLTYRGPDSTDGGITQVAENISATTQLNGSVTAMSSRISPVSLVSDGFTLPNYSENQSGTVAKYLAFR